LSEAEISHCILKGLPIGERYYGDAGLRQAGDIDLLSQPTMLDRACSQLADAGYRTCNAIDHFTPRQRSYFLFTDNQLEFEAPDSGTVIELHWRPLQLPSSLAGLDLSAQTNRWAVADCRIPFLDDEETLLHLCAHGAKHAWYRMKWVFDLPNVLESREWDWAALRVKAQHYRCERELLLGLAVAEALSGWEVPATVRPWLDELDAPGRYFSFIAQALTRPDRWMNTPAGIFKRNRYLAHFNDGVDCWLYHLATFATHRRDWELLPLPDALFPLYFLLSPFTNTWQIAQRFVHSLSGKNGRGDLAPVSPHPTSTPER
ncbi:MAG TPA: nucleotidyltransferase family protein, partial [Pseudomonas sp.]|nr:nucleotidyltransferase family protein [Pseudomonas sp.]